MNELADKLAKAAARKLIFPLTESLKGSSSLNT